MCVLAAALLWGTTGTAATMAPAVGPLAIGAVAMGLGGLLQAVTGTRALVVHRAGLARQWRVLVLSGVAVGVYPLAFYSSMRLAGVAVGTVVSIGSAPAAAAVIERLVDRQPLSRRWAAGALTGIVGVALLAVAAPSDTHSTPADGEGPLLGIALGLVAGLSYAFYSWAAARLMRGGIPSRTAMGAAFGLGGLLLLPVLVTTGRPILDSAQNLAVAAYLAVIPMGLGYLLFGRGLAVIPASTATTLSLLEPAVAALIAVLVLHEQLPPPGWVGIAMLFVSLAITTAKGSRRPSTSTPTQAELESEPQPQIVR